MALPDWEVAARVAVADLVEAYVSGVDGGSLDELVSLFAEDGVLVVHGGAEHHGREDILAFMTASRKTRKKSPVGRIRHHTSRSRVRFDSPTSATGAVYFVAMSEQRIDHWGIYDDVLTSIDGAWYFDRRTVTIEGADPEGWIGSGASLLTFDRR